MARKEKRDMEARPDNTHVAWEYLNTMGNFSWVRKEIDNDCDPQAAALLTAAIVLHECANDFLTRADDLIKSVRKVGEIIESYGGKIERSIDSMSQVIETM